MSKGKTWYVDRRTKQTLRHLEYVASKPLLWAIEAREKSELQASRRLTTSERIRFKHWLLWKYGPQCGYCGIALPIEVLTIDHIHPRSKGGAVRDIQNMLLACLGCNRTKGNAWSW